ncbi:MAG: cellulase family glycosylhydrolase [Clostridiales bacterium]|nr:cellulase family glycosylhydrolase [Clostridiales bacterium]
MRTRKLISLVLVAALSLSVVFFVPDLFSREYVAAAAVDGDDWLHTSGGKIVDAQGREVRLTGINWFGYNTGTNIFDGCWSINMASGLKAIADHGFNLLRIPISSELILSWKNGQYPQANYNSYTNPELNGKNSLQILDYAVAKCREYGIKIMFDIHSLDSNGGGHMYEYWYNGTYSEDKWIESLTWLTAHYNGNDTVLAIDLKNEPHGGATWDGSSAQNNWRRAATRAGNAILDINPNLLIVIEGIESYNGQYAFWGANLMGVRSYPVDFGSADRNDQIVYSPHDYGPAVYQQPWFHGGSFSFNTLYNDYWHNMWLYIKEENIAPILIGEWGGFMDGGANQQWMNLEARLINRYGLSYTFWCFNANSGDTGGLVGYDFTTWDEAKYALVRPTLWQTSSGRFIGLDHQVALGSNGVTVTGGAGSAVTSVSPQDITPVVTADDRQYTMDFIERLYVNMLGRSSDSAGKNYWYGRLANHSVNGLTLADGFYYSNEFIAMSASMSNEEFVRRMYNTILGREPDGVGLPYWIGKLDSGAMTREQVYRGFLYSPEWCSRCENNPLLRW